ncbi:ABC transporter substrate-binding protein [Hanstruepera neustonica]|uniref:ABC transporter substrate-binding protein n=1 Tax=Hanstruepera neustonica TaxID=1445657 RepID=A0A2K1E3R4_9FLAO|nr:two-component regulator propeller domain-containing protein [Hanstruepera neustonica]PNQ74926.1 ABC transporter substrate-binding protein [Hanstruepera neustonica]
MVRDAVLFVILISTFFSYSQDFSSQWQGHFSYLNIKDVSQGNDKLYAAAENAIFIYDTQTQETTTLSTINGLSGETISQIHYSEAYELLVIGYENGLMEIVFDNDDNVLTIVDILEKPTIPPTDKNINHFNEYEGLIYISTDYGISVYDLARLEFGDTYFMGDGGAQITVRQTTVHEGYIYAACINANGIKKALVTSDDLVDFEEWQRIRNGNYLTIESFEFKIFTTRDNMRIFEGINDVFSVLFAYDDQPIDLRVVDNYLVLATENDVFVYDVDFNLIAQVQIPDPFVTSITSATLVGEHIYIGTTDFGVLKTEIFNPLEFEELHPDGPLLNNSFSIDASPNNLWVTFGEYTLTYNWFPRRSRGISHLKEGEWINTPYENVLDAVNLNKTSVNPFNPAQVFISSFGDGLLEVSNEIPTTLYDNSNSGLEPENEPTDDFYPVIRQCASTFDRSGILWTMTARVDKPLKSFDPGSNQWQRYDFLSLIQDGENEWGYGDIIVDDNGTKWIGGYNFGLIGFNENNTGVKLKSLMGEEQNMPANFVTGLALDRRNQMWIGTNQGLRVLYNTSNFFSEENVQAQQIIILEEGVPKELLFQQFVSDIEVDGSNNKWIATIASGLFYFSSDGQQTLYHFTKENSPLPSNNVVDVSIDGASGTVYIATDKGLVSFKAGGLETQDTLQNAYVYPNPVRPTFDIANKKVKINGISENVNIKITDIEGNLVAEAQSKTNLRFRGYNLEIDGGVAFWNGKNLMNDIVASGVYLVMLSDLDTFETKVLKVMVVR